MTGNAAALLNYQLSYFYHQYLRQKQLWALLFCCYILTASFMEKIKSATDALDNNDILLIKW